MGALVGTAAGGSQYHGRAALWAAGLGRLRASGRGIGGSGCCDACRFLGRRRRCHIRCGCRRILAPELVEQQGAELRDRVGAANREPNEGELGGGEDVLDELVALLAVGAVVAAIVQLEAEQGLKRVGVAEEEVDVLAVDAVGGGADPAWRATLGSLDLA